MGPDHQPVRCVITRQSAPCAKTYQLPGHFRLTARNYLVSCLSRFFLTGDWCALYKGAGSGCTFVTDATGYFYFISSLDALTRMATATGRDSDAQRYSGISESTRAQFQQQLWSPSTCLYGGGTPVETAVALQMGLVAPQDLPCVSTALARYYNSTSQFPLHMDGGILSTTWVWPWLSDSGNHGLAVTMATQTDFPSYGYWFGGGGTTLFERWQNTMQVQQKDSSLSEFRESHMHRLHS